MVLLLILKYGHQTENFPCGKIAKKIESYMATYNILLGTHTNIVGEIVFFGFTRVTGTNSVMQELLSTIDGYFKKGRK